MKKDTVFLVSLSFIDCPVLVVFSWHTQDHALSFIVYIPKIQNCLHETIDTLFIDGQSLQTWLQRFPISSSVWGYTCKFSLRTIVFLRLACNQHHALNFLCNAES